jgi:hypothetical protein
MILRWLISAIGFTALKGEASSIARRVGRRATLVALLALLWLTAFGLALAALTAWLSDELGVIAACAIMAAGLTVTGLAIQLALVLGNGRKPQSGFNFPIPGLTANPDGAPGAEGANLGSMAVVAIAGYLLGRQLFRR